MSVLDIVLGYWQWILFVMLVLIGFVVNIFDKDEERVDLFIDEMPVMSPIPIPTKGKGFWGALWIWIGTTRHWVLEKDFTFYLGSQSYVIPAGFVFDGASIPKFMRSWLSPVGILLLGGLVHDYIYKYQVLIKGGKTQTTDLFTQKEADQLFRDICIEVNGFKVLNYLAYYALRLGGFVAWNGHRKRDKEREDEL